MKQPGGRTGLFEKSEPAASEVRENLGPIKSPLGFHKSGLDP